MSRPIDWSNKVQVLEQVKKEGTFLRKATTELKQDKDVIKAAVLNNRDAFRKIDTDYKSVLAKDKPFFLDVLKENGLLLEYASDELKSDIEIVSTAITNNGLSIKYVDTFINNPSIIFMAISQNGMALEFASEELQNNFFIVLNAVLQNGFAIQFASDVLKENKDIVIAALKQDSRSKSWLSHSIKSDPEIMDIIEDESNLIKKFQEIDTLKTKTKYDLLKKNNTCCDDETVKIFNLHGDINFNDNYDVTFTIPPKTSIITITSVGDKCPLAYLFRQQFTEFYKSNKTLFKHNDTSKLLTEDGKSFETHVKSKWSKSIYQGKPHNYSYSFKNHLEGDVMNNFNYSWTGNECQHLGNLQCSMNCLSFNRENKFVNIKEDCVHDIYSETGKLKRNFTLKDLVDYNGTGVYIILSCRSLNLDKDAYDSSLKETQTRRYMMQRTLSGTNEVTNTNRLLSDLPGSKKKSKKLKKLKKTKKFKVIKSKKYNVRKIKKKKITRLRKRHLNKV